MDGSTGKTNAFLRPYLSRTAQSRVLLSSVALAVPGWYCVVRDLDSVGAFLLGVAVAGFLLALVAITETQACAFCGSSRAEVSHLVAGRSVSICDACLALSVGVVIEGDDDKEAHAKLYGRVLGVLPPQCPTAISSPLLSLLADKEPTLANLRKLWAQAYRLGNFGAALDLSRRIPESERRAEDWIHLGVALGGLRRYAEAIAATQMADQKPDGECRYLAVNNLAWFRLRIETVSRAECNELLSDVQTARELLGELGRFGPRIEAHLWGTEADIKRLLGDVEGGMQALERSKNYWPLTPERLVTRAQLSISGSDTASAVRDLKCAAADAHPESILATEIKALLSTIAPSPQSAERFWS